MSGRRGFLPPRNSNCVWVRGVLDDADSEDANGNPKFIDDATVTWDLLSADTDDGEIALATGIVLASGSGLSAGEDGAYLISISHSIAIAPINWLHVIVLTPSGFKADLMGRFDKMTRSGGTPTT